MKAATREDGHVFQTNPLSLQQKGPPTIDNLKPLAFRHGTTSISHSMENRKRKKEKHTKKKRSFARIDGIFVRDAKNTSVPPKNGKCAVNTNDFIVHRAMINMIHNT